MSAFDTPLQRLYASQEDAPPPHMPGSPSSRLPPFILTGYQPAGGNVAGRPRYPAPGSYAPPAEDEIVARQLASMARPHPSDAIAAASASRSSLVPTDAALMARAMVMESERRRHHALMQAQAQARAAQAQAMNMGMPSAHNMGSDDDILAAIQQRQRFLGRLEVEFKAKMAARGGGGGL